jgi:RNA polymerase sigma-70 factor (ECF subfamily)
MMALDADKILSDVPRMRRYAALMFLNDKERGDQLVEQALKDLVADPAVLDGQEDIRPPLLRTLQRHVASAFASADGGSTALLAAPQAPAVARPPGAFPADDVLAALAGMPVEQRSALLLVAVEGLSCQQAGFVLGTAAEIVQALLEDAREALELGRATPSKSA